MREQPFSVAELRRNKKKCFLSETMEILYSCNAINLFVPLTKNLSCHGQKAMNIHKQSQIIVIRAMSENCDKDGRNMFIHSEKGNEHAIQISFMRE